MADQTLIERDLERLALRSVTHTSGDDWNEAIRAGARRSTGTSAHSTPPGWFQPKPPPVRQPPASVTRAQERLRRLHEQTLQALGRAGFHAALLDSYYETSTTNRRPDELEPNLPSP